LLLPSADGIQEGRLKWGLAGETHKPRDAWKMPPPTQFRGKASIERNPAADNIRRYRIDGGDGWTWDGATTASTPTMKELQIRPRRELAGAGAARFARYAAVDLLQHGLLKAAVRAAAHGWNGTLCHGTTFLRRARFVI
jgi:hypothetical protein